MTTNLEERARELREKLIAVLMEHETRVAAAPAAGVK